MIPSGAAGGAYSFTDYFLRPDKTYYYKIECVGASGSTFIGPLAVTTKKLFGSAK